MATGWREQYNFRYKVFLTILSTYREREDVRAFLEVILSITTIIIFIVFALRPTALTIISLYNQIQDKKATLNGLHQKLSDLQTANNVFNQNQNAISDIDAAIFNKPEPDTVTKQILGLATKNSVNLLGVLIGPTAVIGKAAVPATSADIKPLPASALAMPVTINVKGNYSDLIAFVKDLENLRIPIEFDVLTISSSQTQEGSVIVCVVVGRIPYIGQQ